MLRILLADDHAVVRHGVKQILADAYAGATFWRSAKCTRAAGIGRGAILGYCGFGPEPCRAEMAWKR